MNIHKKHAYCPGRGHRPATERAARVVLPPPTSLPPRKQNFFSTERRLVMSELVTLPTVSTSGPTYVPINKEVMERPDYNSASSASKPPKSCKPPLARDLALVAEQAAEEAKLAGPSDEVYGEDDFMEEPRMPHDVVRKQTVKWREELSRALREVGVKEGITPMRRVALAFYEDKRVMVDVLKVLVPQLKSIDANFGSQEPFRLIIELPPENMKRSLASEVIEGGDDDI